MDKHKDVAKSAFCGKSKKVFGRSFPDNARANGLMAVWRWGPITPRTYALHAGLVPGDHVKKRMLPGLARSAKATIKTVKLSNEGVAGADMHLYALTKAGYDYLVECAEDYWPDVDPIEALGPWARQPDTARWRPTFDHNNVTRDILLSAERDAPNLANVSIVDQVAEFANWGGMRAPTAMETSIGRRMKSDAANIMCRGDATFADEIEIDMGNETLQSEDPAREPQTIAGKYRNYWSVLADTAILGKYNVTTPVFRVLMITTNETRAGHLVDLASHIGLEPIRVGNRDITPNDIFLATTIERARAAFFGEHWLKANGDVVSLAKRAAL